MALKPVANIWITTLSPLELSICFYPAGFKSQQATSTPWYSFGIYWIQANKTAADQSDISAKGNKRDL